MSCTPQLYGIRLETGHSLRSRAIHSGLSYGSGEPLLHLSGSERAAGVRFSKVGSFLSQGVPGGPESRVYADQTGFAEYLWFFQDAYEWQLQTLINDIHAESPAGPLVTRCQYVPRAHRRRGPSNTGWLRRNGVQADKCFDIYRVQGLGNLSSVTCELEERLLRAWEPQ